MKLFCNNCKKHTNHVQLFKSSIGSSGDDEYQWGEDHLLVQCAGCDVISYAVEYSSEDDYNPATGERESAWKRYPNEEGARTPAIERHTLPSKVERIYLEVIAALNNKSPILTGIGLRALIETLCKESKAGGKDLKARIDSMATIGVLSKKQAEILHSHRFLGNLAAHEVEAAKPQELVAALEIAETILKTIYVLPALSDSIETGKPKKVSVPAPKVVPVVLPKS